GTPAGKRPLCEHVGLPPGPSPRGRVVPTIVSIAFKPANLESKPRDRYARIAVEMAELVAGKGIAEDKKGSGAERHLNVMARETLDQLQAEGCKTSPGEMGEQIVVAGIDIDR